MIDVLIHFYDWQKIDGEEESRLLSLEIESFSELDDLIKENNLKMDDINVISIYKEGTKFLDREE